MESFIDIFKSDHLLHYTLFAIVIFAVLYVIIRLYVCRVKNDNLNRDLDVREDGDDLDESDYEKPKGRFFIIESYYLPDDWEETFDVIVDRQTKVQYLNYVGCGISPLIDADGKPILYKDDDEKQEESE